MIRKLFGKKTEEPGRSGKFIVIDGPDGTGKTTQIELLAKTLSETGYDGAVFDFPQYSTASAGPLEKYLGGDYGEVGPEPASIFYAVDRFDASFKLRESLHAGKVILSNRYVTSNAGHQGAKIEDKQERIKFYKWLDHLEYGIFNVPKPDLNIILHIPSEMSWELIQERGRTQNRKTDIHEQDRHHLEMAEQVYLEIAELFPNTRLIECVEDGRLLAPIEIHTKIWELVRRITLKDFPPHHS